MRNTLTPVTRVTTFLNKRGTIVLAAAVLLVAAAFAGILQLQIDTDFAVFMPAESRYVLTLGKVAGAFGDADQLIILTESGRNPGELKRLQSLAGKLTEIPGITGTQAPLPASSEEMDDREIEDLLERFERISGTSVLPEYGGKFWGVLRCLIEPEADFRRVLKEVRSVLDEDGRIYYLSGEPYLEATVFDYIFRILLTLPPVAILLMLTVFRIRIGSARATALSMIPAVFSAILTLGAVAWLSGGVSIVTVLVPVFIIVLGSADGLHITSHVMDSLDAGMPNFEAVRKTLKEVGGAIIMTTVTTMAGFLSLLLIKSPAIREMAVTATAGILIAGIATWFIIPTLLLRMKPIRRKRRPREGSIRSFLAGMIGPKSIVVSAFILAASIPGIIRLQANFSMIDIYKPSTEVRKNIDAVTSILDGSIPVYLVFDTADPFDRKTADAVLEFEEKALDRGIIGSGMSAYRIIASASESLTGRPGYPTNALFAERAAALVSRFNPTFMSTFFSDKDLGRAVFFLKDLDDKTVKAFIDTAAEVSSGTGVSLECAGTAFVMQEMNSQILPQQMYSLLLAAAVVFILITLSQKSIRLGLVSTIPILITLAALFGVMGYARLDVSVITGIMSGLTVGVGIDYAIHFMAMYRGAARRKETDPILSALFYVATPVTANALGLAIGFTALSFSPLSIHLTLSVLMWVTMTVSAFLSLTLLPSLIGLRKKRRPFP
ncbi:MAG: RND family transporter [Spirochaetales bacterium]|nr:RND family transporter [Spirochaetales bacterium]